MVPSDSFKNKPSLPNEPEEKTATLPAAGLVISLPEVFNKLI
jgi:hypothetical protein